MAGDYNQRYFCALCQSRYYGFHYCSGQSYYPDWIQSSATWHPVPKVVRECPKCHRVYSPSQFQCGNCALTEKLCAPCHYADGYVLNGERVAVEYAIGWPSKHLDMEWCCNLCITRLIDTEYERLHPKEA